MTVWLDAQLQPSLAAWIGSRFGVIAKHVKEMALERASDAELYAAARRFGDITILSKDSDFVELSRRLGAPPQVVYLRCGNLSEHELHILLSLTFPGALERLKQGEAFVEINAPQP